MALGPGTNPYAMAGGTEAGLGYVPQPQPQGLGYVADPAYNFGQASSNTGESGWLASAVDWGKGFALSAAESFPELVGITPSESTQEWRAQNPWSGVASELVSIPLPYIGWMKAARAIPAIEKVARAAEGAYKTSPFLSAAAGEVTRLLPFEVGRVGVSQMVGDKPLGEMATDALINTAAGGVLSGAITSIGRLGKVAPKLGDIIPGLSEAGDLPPQLILRKVDEVLANAPEMMPTVQPHIERLEDFARAQTESGRTYVAPLIQGDTNEVNRLFQPGNKNGVVKMRPIQGKLDDIATYDNLGEWQDDFLKVNATPHDVTRNMQYPRVIKFDKGLDEAAAAEAYARDALHIDQDMKAAQSHMEATATAEGWTKERYQREWADKEASIKAPYNMKEFPGATRRAGRIEESIADNFKPVGDNWFLTRESEDGLYVMARKIEGRVGKATPEDKWVVFKTDNPGKFHTKAQTTANGDIAREKWIITQNTVEANARPGTLAGALADTQKVYNFSSYADASKVAGGPGRLKAFVDRATPEALRGNYATQQMKQLFNTYFIPAAQQLAKSTRGRWLLGQGRLLQGMVDNYGEQLLRGKATLKAGTRSLLTQPFRRGGGLEFAGGGATGVLDRAAADGVFDEVMGFIRKGISPNEAAALSGQGKASKLAAKYALELDQATSPLFKEMNSLQRMAGETETRPHRAHYGFERSWEGDHLTAIRGEGEEVIGIAAGATRGASQREAKNLAGEITKDLGRPVRVAETFMRGRTEGGIPRDLWPFSTNPGFMLERKNIRGFKYDTTPPTLREAKEWLQDSFQRKQRAMGVLARRSLLDRHLQSLSVEDPYALSVVSTRFNQMAGVEGEFSKAQNAMADKVLAPFLGNNSATKIVQTTNAFLMHMQLGAFKLSYPISNIVGTLQTVVPELAFVRNGLPETVNGTYHMAVPLVGAKGPNGFMGVLNPLKVFAQTFKEMGRPDAALRAGFERAVNDRVVTPRMVEEYLGAPDKPPSFKNALLNPKSWFDALKVGSQYLPGSSEEFARNVAFTAGWIAARDVRGVKDPDAIYQFAKQFTERTSYLYSASDRPNMFNGPVGSSMGLFKNWMMNYMTSMAEYTRLGVQENTWSPLMWQTIGTFATGGAAATPVYWAAEGAARMFQDKSMMQMAYDDFTGGQADAIMFGLPAALTGVSLSSAMTSPGANPVRDATQLFSLAIWDRAKYVQKAAGAAVDGYMTTGDLNTPTFREYLTRAFAPVNLYRTMATWEDDAIRTLGTDMPQMTGLGFYDKWLYRMGLQPVELERQLKAADAVYTHESNRKAAVSAFGAEMADAMRAQDSVAQERILRRAVAVGLDISAVYKSMQTRVKLQQQGMLERAGSRVEDIRWQNVREPQPGGLFGQ